VSAESVRVCVREREKEFSACSRERSVCSRRPCRRPELGCRAHSRCPAVAALTTKNDACVVQVVVAAEGVKTTPDGVDAVVRLGGGDMRKTLNILQSTVMATGAGTVDEAAVYACTGSPLPADIEQCIQVRATEPPVGNCSLISAYPPLRPFPTGRVNRSGKRAGRRAVSAASRPPKRTVAASMRVNAA
jgi:hypothetical protein